MPQAWSTESPEKAETPTHCDPASGRPVASLLGADGYKKEQLFCSDLTGLQVDWSIACGALNRANARFGILPCRGFARAVAEWWLRLTVIA